MDTTKEIIKLISSYDATHMMSDSSSTYYKGQAQKIEIETALKAALIDTLIEVRNSIELTDKFISIPFGEYFEDLTEAPAKAKPQSKLSKIMSTAWEMFNAELIPSFALKQHSLKLMAFIGIN